jgi:hypothetical protein
VECRHRPRTTGSAQYVKTAQPAQQRAAMRALTIMALVAGNKLAARVLSHKRPSGTLLLAPPFFAAYGRPMRTFSNQCQDSSEFLNYRLFSDLGLSFSVSDATNVGHINSQALSNSTVKSSKERNSLRALCNCQFVLISFHGGTLSLSSRAPTISCSFSSGLIRPALLTSRITAGQLNCHCTCQSR